MRRILFVLFVLLTNILKSQEMMREKFDFEIDKEVEKKGYYIKPNGNIVLGTFLDRKHKGEYWEIVNKYPYYFIYKKYYPNGYIKSYQTLIGLDTAFGETLLYDEQGNITRINEDKKFEDINFKISDVLLFLQEKKVLNIKDGTIWYDKYFRFRYRILFSDYEGEKFWIIMVKEDIDPNESIDFSKGRPRKYNIIWYYIDAITRKIYTEEEFIERNKSPETTHTFQGKTYTEEEWKSFEQEQRERYQAKRDKKSFSERLFG